MSTKLSKAQQELHDRMKAGELVNAGMGGTYYQSDLKTVNISTLVALSKRGYVKCVFASPIGNIYAHVDVDYQPPAMTEADEILTF